jgi:hypothetical protein
MTAEKLQAEKPKEKVWYQYLGQCSTSTHPNSIRDNAHQLKQLKVTFKTISLSKQHVAQMCQLIATIPHLDNLKFTINHSHNVGAAVM